MYVLTFLPNRGRCRCRRRRGCRRGCSSCRGRCSSCRGRCRRRCRRHCRRGGWRRRGCRFHCGIWEKKRYTRPMEEKNPSHLPALTTL